MKAMVITKAGGLEVFQKVDLPTPQPGYDEVLVRVHATSINPYDIDRRVAEGLLAEEEFPFILGADVSGVIVETGSKANKFKPGDEVFFLSHNSAGSNAEYVAVRESEVSLKPANLSHEEAASFPIGALTAWSGLQFLEVFAGDTLLVYGAGSVGINVIQIAKAMGLRVIATASPQTFDIAKELGADRVINHQEEDLVQAVNEFTNGQGVDGIFDSVGSSKLIKAGYGLIKPHVNKMVTTLPMRAVEIPRLNFKLLVLFDKNREAGGRILDRLKNLIEWGKLKPVVDRVMDFDEIPEAHQLYEKRGLKGKIIIKVNPAE